LTGSDPEFVRFRKLNCACFRQVQNVVISVVIVDLYIQANSDISWVNWYKLQTAILKYFNIKMESKYSCTIVYKMVNYTRVNN